MTPARSGAWGCFVVADSRGVAGMVLHPPLKAGRVTGQARRASWQQIDRYFNGGWPYTRSTGSEKRYQAKAPAHEPKGEGAHVLVLGGSPVHHRRPQKRVLVQVHLNHKTAPANPLRGLLLSFSLSLTYMHAFACMYICTYTCTHARTPPRVGVLCACID